MIETVLHVALKIPNSVLFSIQPVVSLKPSEDKHWGLETLGSASKK